MAFEVLKERQATAWGAGQYELVADNAADVHGNLIDRLGVRPGEHWLDVATGTGAVAIRTARRGAIVTGQDFAVGLIDTARRLAAKEGIDIRFDVGDCERLPYSDESFDVVCSALGAVFAPDHQAVAHELTRVCRADGQIGLAAWRPGGTIASFFRMVGAFQPPPPDGAGNPFDWGRREYVQDILGDAFTLEFFDDESPMLGDSPEAVWDLFVAGFGPIKALAASLDEKRRHELHDAFVDLLSEYLLDDGSVSFPREWRRGRRASSDVTDVVGVRTHGACHSGKSSTACIQRDPDTESAPSSPHRPRTMGFRFRAWRTKAATST
ncbi:MAG: methyltransferase domain-containing protein [Solirubrobacteraceae bacterium]